MTNTTIATSARWIVERGVFNALYGLNWNEAKTGIATPTHAKLAIFSQSTGTPLLSIEELDGFDAASNRWILPTAQSEALPDPLLPTTPSDLLYQVNISNDGTAYWPVARGQVFLRNDPIENPGGGSVPNTSPYVLESGLIDVSSGVADSSKPIKTQTDGFISKSLTGVERDTNGNVGIGTPPIDGHALSSADLRLHDANGNIDFRLRAFSGLVATDQYIVFATDISSTDTNYHAAGIELQSFARVLRTPFRPFISVTWDPAAPTVRVDAYDLGGAKTEAWAGIDSGIIKVVIRPDETYYRYFVNLYRSHYGKTDWFDGWGMSFSSTLPAWATVQATPKNVVQNLHVENSATANGFTQFTDTSDERTKDSEDIDPQLLDSIFSSLPRVRLHTFNGKLGTVAGRRTVAHTAQELDSAFTVAGVNYAREWGIVIPKIVSVWRGTLTLYSGENPTEEAEKIEKLTVNLSNYEPLFDQWLVDKIADT